jgi:4-aminobutyrate aminotransferase / (S)-3-amino-2-methylpropionate transaminase / 5-aminovalerate transaminase
MIQEKVAKIVTLSLPGPKSQKLLARRQQYVARGVSTGTSVFIAEAKDALIKDVDGNVFIDFAAGIGIQNAGHCDPEVIKAIQEQAEKYIHPCFHIMMYEPYVALGEVLAGLTPGKFPKKIMLANSGAEAVENAIKISRRYTGKTGVVTLECAFHGRTYMAMTITSKVKPYKYKFGPFCPDTYKIPTPYCYRCQFGSNYPECGLACAERFRTLLKSELAADNIATLIAEPVQGEGGFIVMPEGYLPAIQSICKEYGIVFVIDEVQSGFARTGKMFASEYYHIEPDLVTVSKSLAAGVPLSGVIGKAEIMDAPDLGEIGGTYGGSPLGCVAALEVIKKIQREKLSEKANQIGTILKSRLERLKDQHETVGDVRGLGAMCGIEFVKERGSKTPNPEIVKQIVAYSYNKGVIFMNAGIFGNVIRFLPPLVMTEEQLQYGMDVLEEAVHQCS